jgi:hypothetical protein
MADLDRSLDSAIDALAVGEPVADARSEELHDLVELARLLRALPESQWPDPTFPDRLLAGLDGHRSPARRAWTHWPTRSGWRLGLASATAVTVIVAVALLFTLNRASTVSAAVLARRAAEASLGRGLPPVTYTQVVTNRPVPGSFEPVPAPPRIVELATFANTNHWRVHAIVTEPHGEGIDTTLTVRNGDTVVSVTRSSHLGTTETRTRATSGAGLPTAATYGSRIDPRTLLRAARGRCGRRVSLVGDGPSIAGRKTLVLRLGPNPCPSADMPEVNGPATFLIDARTYLVLDAKVFALDGHTLVQHLQTTHITYRTPIAPSMFRLPVPLRIRRTPSFVPLTPDTSRSKLQARAAFTVLLPTRLPPGLHPQAITTVATQPTTGKLLGFTITYADAANRPVLQLYEAPAASPSVRFPGRRVTIRAGITGTYSGSRSPRFLWWIQNGSYISLQEGGSSAGTPLLGRFDLRTLRALAASIQ